MESNFNHNANNNDNGIIIMLIILPKMLFSNYA